MRRFAAISLPEDIGRLIQGFQSGIGGARWRSLEQFHITLAFYGDVADPQAEALDLALAQADIPPLDLQLSGAGSFAEGHDVHAAWLGVAPNEGLERLARIARKAARDAGLTVSARKYMPHVTLAYLRHADPVQVGAWIANHNLFRSPVFRVSDFGLYTSRQTAGGSAYRLDAGYALACR